MELEEIQCKDKRASVSDLFQTNNDGDCSLNILQERTAAKLASAREPKLGTFIGVYVPCLQNLLGVILFLRLTWITAHAGTWGTTLILFSCVGTTFLTTLSLGAICSNGKIPNGGAYFVISRNLGKEYGAATCLLFYIGKTLTGALYCLGAAEAFQATFSLENAFTYDMQVQSIVIALFLSAIVFFGLKYVNMASFIILAVVLLSIVSCIFGLILNLTGIYTSLDPGLLVSGDNVHQDYEYDPVFEGDTNFASLLALLYPAVSGSLAGTTRTGLLSTPSRSISHGTLAAVATSTVIYLVFIWLFGSTLSNTALREDKLILSSVSWPHPKILNFGIMFSAIGCALQAFTTASRVLVAISNDKVMRILRFTNVPRALIVTCSLVSLLCLTGDLDVISPVVTMFMLVMYLSINLACFVLSALRTPSFRPSWRWFHWSTALAGVLWCGALMLIISWPQALISTGVTLLVWMYISYQKASEDWGSALRGLKLELARKMLSSLRRPESICDVKSWRPQLLVLARVNDTGQVHKVALLDFANQMKKGKGFLEVVGFIQGSTEIFDKAREATMTLAHQLEKRHIIGFATVNATQSIVEAISITIQSSGLGEMQSNSVLVGWPNGWRDETDGISPLQFTKMIGTIIAARKSLLVLKVDSTYPTSSDSRSGYIDIWWILHDGGLLMLIPYLLKRHRVWKTCTLRLFTVVGESTNSLEVQRNLMEYMNQLRIQAEVVVIEMSSTDISELVSQRTLDMVTGRQLLEKANLQKPGMTMLLRQSSTSPGLSDIFKNLPDYDPDTIVGYKSETTATKPEEIDAERMEHAIRLREKVMEHSSKAALVVMNLPRAKGVLPTDFMEYVEVLTEGLDNVLLIRGSGQEVVTVNG